MATVRMLPSKTLQEWHYSFSTLASASSLYETALLQCAQPYWAIEDEASIANRILPCVGFSRLCMALINKLPTYVLFWHSYWCWKKRVPSVFFWFFFPSLAFTTLPCALFEKGPSCFRTFLFDLCNKLVTLHPPHHHYGLFFSFLFLSFLFFSFPFFSIFHSPKHANYLGKSSVAGNMFRPLIIHHHLKISTTVWEVAVLQFVPFLEDI